LREGADLAARAVPTVVAPALPALRAGLLQKPGLEFPGLVDIF
jgi:hypothetical protein